MRRFAPLLLVTLLAGSSGAKTPHAEFPASVEAGGKTLALNGKATFRKWLFSVYDVALYLEAKSQDPKQVVAADAVKQLRLRMLRDAPREQMVNILRWRLQTVAGKNYEAIRARVDTLLNAIPEVKSGGELVISYLPGTGTVMTAPDGKQLTVEGKDFADALFNVWLEDGRVRPGLMGQ